MSPTQEFLETLENELALETLHSLNVNETALEFLPYCREIPEFIGCLIKMAKIDNKKIRF